MIWSVLTQKGLAKIAIFYKLPKFILLSSNVVDIVD